MAISALAASTLPKGAHDSDPWRPVSTDLIDRDEFRQQLCQCFPGLQYRRRKQDLHFRGPIAYPPPRLPYGR